MQDFTEWYEVIERFADVSLGNADKLLLKNYLFNLDENNSGFVGGICAFLDNFGFESKTLTEKLKKVREHERYCGEVYWERYNQLKKTDNSKKSE